MITQKRRSRTLKNQPPPPAPIVTRRDDGDYNVESRRSGKVYAARVSADGHATCGCLARTVCYHLPYVERLHSILHLSDGDAVLVSERGGQVWHTAIGADAERVYTLEVPAGFRHGFVIRCERGERQVAA